jgi:molybdenum cofactor cytidylyltransferase
MSDRTDTESGPANRGEEKGAKPTGSAGSVGAAEAANEPPVIDPADLAFGSRGRVEDDRRTEDGHEGSIVAVLLAAGTSSRFGAANKLLATVDGQPIVRRAATTLCEAAVGGVIAVTGFEAKRVEGVLDGLDVEAVRNAAYERGQSTSVRAGVRAASDREASAVVIALGDMPAVDAATIDALTDAYRANAGDALAAAHGGRRGNPVLFDARYFEALSDVSGDIGGREILLESGRAALVETGDPGVLNDVDTQADLEGIE